MKLLFTQAAERDLRAILRYTDLNWGRDQARRYVAGLQDHLAKLCLHPALGASVSQGRKGTRRWAYISHIAYYRAEGDQIRIIRILHASQEPERHLP